MNLNDKQKKVLEYLDGQSLVIACPGSGKTTTMIARANALIQKGVPEEQILVITFTKNAAESMKKKYQEQYGNTNINFGTIHALCFQILREMQGYVYENILKELDKWNFFYEYAKKYYKNMNANDREELFRNVFTEISFVKNADIPLNEYSVKCMDDDKFSRFFSAYEKYKQENDKVDFDDMLLLTRELFKQNPKIPVIYRKKYPYIMVDEFQDTNVIQANIIYSIVGEDGNLCIVGDDDQSIYGFRSADSSIMLNFKKAYPNCQTFFLDTNYRSKPEIIEKAELLINHNKTRFKKSFQSHQKGKSNITCNKYNDIDMQSRSIVKKLKQFKRPLEEMAILYRTNEEKQNIIHYLLKENIDFQTNEMIRDYHQERAFQDILCYYRLSQGTANRGDMKTVLNRPKRYLKSELFEEAENNRGYMLKQCEYTKNPTNSKRMVNKMFRDIQNLGKLKPEYFVEYLFYDMNYRQSYIEYMDFIGKSKDMAIETLTILENEAAGFKTMKDWIAYANTYAEKIKEKRKNKKGIVLSTYHSAKGLEWETVFLIDCNDGFTPYRKAQTEKEIEEERRLFYVAFTRAKKDIHISYITRNGRERMDISPFLGEMGIGGEEKGKEKM